MNKEQRQAWIENFKVNTLEPLADKLSVMEGKQIKSKHYEEQLQLFFKKLKQYEDAVKKHENLLREEQSA